MGLEAMRREIRERYERLLRSHHRNPERVEPITPEDLERRIRGNVLRLILLGDECPIKHFVQLREDLEMWERYEATGLLPPPPPPPPVPEVEVEVT